MHQADRGSLPFIVLKLEHFADKEKCIFKPEFFKKKKTKKQHSSLLVLQLGDLCQLPGYEHNTFLQFITSLGSRQPLKWLATYASHQLCLCLTCTAQTPLPCPLPAPFPPPPPSPTPDPTPASVSYRAALPAGMAGGKQRRRRRRKQISSFESKFCGLTAFRSEIRPRKRESQGQNQKQ